MEYILFPIIERPFIKMHTVVRIKISSEDVLHAFVTTFEIVKGVLIASLLLSYCCCRPLIAVRALITMYFASVLVQMTFQYSHRSLHEMTLSLEPQKKNSRNEIFCEIIFRR